MKKTILLLTLFTTSLIKAQFFENFENGVPGNLIQNFKQGETNFIDFGISSYQVNFALSESNSAIFCNPMASNSVSSSLQTPILNLSSKNHLLEFKYFQKLKTKNYANTLLVEFSNDGGKNWEKIAAYNQTLNETMTISINLSNYNPTAFSSVKFICTQNEANLGFPIVIDDITIKPSISNKTSQENFTEIKVYPNPSNGIFNINCLDPISISVFDLKGISVYTLNTTTSNTAIDLSNFAKGIYILKIENNTTHEFKKISIQ